MELLPGLASGSGWVAFAVLTLAVFRAIARSDLVPGAIYRQAVKQGDFWRDRALAGTSLAKVATDVVEARADAE